MSCTTFVAFVYNRINVKPLSYSLRALCIHYDFEIRNNTIERGSGLFMSIAITFFKTHFLS